MPCNFDEIRLLVWEVRDKFPDLKIWLYTGYEYEKLTDEQLYFIHGCVNYLVDGPYIEELRDTSLPFRGSTNQHIIEIRP